MRGHAVRSMYTCRPCSASIVLRVAADDDQRRLCNVMLKLSRCIPQCDVRLKPLQSVFCRIRGGADSLNVRFRKVAKSNGFSFGAVLLILPLFYRSSTASTLADSINRLPLFYRFSAIICQYNVVERRIGWTAAADEEVVRTYS